MFTYMNILGFRRSKPNLPEKKIYITAPYFRRLCIIMPNLAEHPQKPPGVDGNFLPYVRKLPGADWTFLLYVRKPPGAYGNFLPYIW